MCARSIEDASEMHLPEDLGEGQSDPGKISPSFFKLPFTDHVLSTYVTEHLCQPPHCGPSGPQTILTWCPSSGRAQSTRGERQTRRLGSTVKGCLTQGKWRGDDAREGFLEDMAGFAFWRGEMKLVKEATVGSRERKQPVNRHRKQRLWVWSMWGGQPFGRAGVWGTREGATGHQGP